MFKEYYRALKRIFEGKKGEDMPEKGCPRCLVDGGLKYPIYDRTPLVETESFCEDPTNPGFGWFIACPECGSFDENRTVEMEDGPISGGMW